MQTDDLPCSLPLNIATIDSQHREPGIKLTLPVLTPSGNTNEVGIEEVEVVRRGVWGCNETEEEGLVRLVGGGGRRVEDYW